MNKPKKTGIAIMHFRRKLARFIAKKRTVGEYGYIQFNRAEVFRWNVANVFRQEVPIRDKTCSRWRILLQNFAAVAVKLLTSRGRISTWISKKAMISTNLLSAGMKRPVVTSGDGALWQTIRRACAPSQPFNGRIRWRRHEAFSMEI